MLRLLSGAKMRPNEMNPLTCAYMCTNIHFMEIMYTAEQVRIANALADVLDSKFFKSLSEPVRIEILRYLLLNGPSDIGTIARDLPQDRSVISRHLNMMLGVDILTCEKQGRHRYYQLNAQAFLSRFTEISDLIKSCIQTCGPGSISSGCISEGTSK